MPKIHALPVNNSPALDDVIPHDDVSTANDDTKQATLANVLALAYPVGSIYTNAAVSTNPATLLGFGTWAAFGAGRVLVGVDTGQTEFDTLGETGGAKTHTLQTTEIPSHTHGIGAGTNQWVRGGVGGTAANITQTGASFRVEIGPSDATGGGGAHNNLQPYITVYMWQRTA